MLPILVILPMVSFFCGLNKQVLSSRDMFWEAMGAKLKAHAEAFGDASCRAEATSEDNVSVRVGSG